jgi:hypothetical protein
MTTDHRLLSSARAAWFAWIVFVGVICLLVFLRPGRRTVLDAYEEGAAGWWGENPTLYGTLELGGDDIEGWLYLPQSAIAYTPFHWMPRTLGEMLWRVLGAGLLAWGLWRLVRLAFPDRAGRAFLLATALVLPTAWSAIRNGQANVHLGALMLHAAVDLARQRWGWAAASLCLSLAAKPLGIVMILLAGALYPAVRWRLALGLAIFFAVPFLHPNPSYVAEQYPRALAQIVRTSQPGERNYAEVFTLLRRAADVHVPDLARQAIRALFALLTLGLCYVGLRRGGRRQGSVLLLGFATCYLMLFNPVTEANSYVIVIPFVALAAVAVAANARRGLEGAFLVAIALGLACDNYGLDFHLFTRYWLKQCLTIVFVAWLAWRTWRIDRRPLLPALGA